MDVTRTVQESIEDFDKRLMDGDPEAVAQMLVLVDAIFGRIRRPTVDVDTRGRT